MFMFTWPGGNRRRCRPSILTGVIMNKAELFSPRREMGESSESCRGQYAWTERPVRTLRSKDMRPGKCYRIDPVTGEKSEYINDNGDAK
jgi:hypothetical protein